MKLVNDSDNMLREVFKEDLIRRKKSFILWILGYSALIISIVTVSFILIRWTWNDIEKRKRVQCLEYNGPLLNACLKNCSLSSKLTHAECEDFCEKISCKEWTR